MKALGITLGKSLLASTLLLFCTITFAAEIVNINKADAAAIQQNLTGIGPVKAEAIVRHRSKIGKFKSLDDLAQVKGVGPALIKKNKKLMSLTKGVSTGDAKAYASAKKKVASKPAKQTAKDSRKNKSKSAGKDSSRSSKKKKTTAKNDSSKAAKPSSKSKKADNKKKSKSKKKKKVSDS